ncbi:MAG TPA: MFS transporter [Stellaceae bacterium]|jgi:MFS family permease|nr:MFS transporter [Stellaceae bacterium]
MSFFAAASRNQTRLILVGAAVLLSLGMGLRQSLGLFLTPVTRDLALTAADFTLAIAVQNIVWGISQAPVGALADRFGLRVTMLAGAGIYVIGLGVMATARGAVALIVSGALIGIALSCTASSLVMTAVARSVPAERRSKTLGLVSAAGSLGTLMVPVTTQSILAHHVWQFGALFFVLLAALMLPSGFFAGGADRMPMTGGSRTTMREMLGQAMRHRPFLVMSGAYFVCGLNLVFLTTHLPTYLAICGQDPMLSAEAIAVIGGVNCFGSLAAGWLGARYPKHILLGLLYILRAFVFTAYFIMPPTPASTLLFAGAMGMLWLSVAPLVSGLVAEMFGTRYMATLLGISFVMHQVGSSLGAWGGGLIFTAYGNYDPAWKIGVLIGFAAGVVQIVAGGPTLRRDRIGAPGLAAG